MKEIILLSFLIFAPNIFADCIWEGGRDSISPSGYDHYICGTFGTLPEVTDSANIGKYGHIEVAVMVIREMDMLKHFLKDIKAEGYEINQEVADELLKLYADDRKIGVKEFSELKRRLAFKVSERDEQLLSEMSHWVDLDEHFQRWLGPIFNYSFSQIFSAKEIYPEFVAPFNQAYEIKQSFENYLDEELFKQNPRPKGDIHQGAHHTELVPIMMGKIKALPPRAMFLKATRMEQLKIIKQELDDVFPVILRMDKTYALMVDGMKIATRDIFDRKKIMDRATLLELARESSNSVAQPYPDAIKDFIQIEEVLAMLDYFYGSLLSETGYDIINYFRRQVLGEKPNGADVIEALGLAILHLGEQVDFDLKVEEARAGL